MLRPSRYFDRISKRLGRSLGDLLHRSTFLSLQAMESLAETRRMSFTEYCCYCGRSGTGLDETAGFGVLRKSWARKVEFAIRASQCREHTDGNGLLLLADVSVYTKHCQEVVVFGYHAVALDAIVKQCRAGTRVPPWVAFPDRAPDQGWGQGAQEGYRSFWLRYFEALSSDEPQAP